jgi:probable FeS assembly SUF system protein SufT
MVRLDAADADVIGKETAARDAAAEQAPLEEQVWAALRTCYDPEIPVNIVDLGLIYDCSLDEPDASGARRAQVKMTLTAPGCGMGQVLADDVKRKLEALPGIALADVEVVFDPPWNQNMMTEAARLQLGMF